MSSASRRSFHALAHPAAELYSRVGGVSAPVRASLHGCRSRHGEELPRRRFRSPAGCSRRAALRHRLLRSLHLADPHDSRRRCRRPADTVRRPMRDRGGCSAPSVARTPIAAHNTSHTAIDAPRIISGNRTLFTSTATFSSSSLFRAFEITQASLPRPDQAAHGPVVFCPAARQRRYSAIRFRQSAEP